MRLSVSIMAHPARVLQVAALQSALGAEVPVWIGGANARYLAEALGVARVRAVSDPAALPRIPRAG